MSVCSGNYPIPSFDTMLTWFVLYLAFRGFLDLIRSTLSSFRFWLDSSFNSHDILRPSPITRYTAPPSPSIIEQLQSLFTPWSHMIPLIAPMVVECLLNHIRNYASRQTEAHSFENHTSETDLLRKMMAENLFNNKSEPEPVVPQTTVQPEFKSDSDSDVQVTTLEPEAPQPRTTRPPRHQPQFT